MKGAHIVKSKKSTKSLHPNVDSLEPMNSYVLRTVLYGTVWRGCVPGLVICSFAHSLIPHLLICSFCSNQMSDCERFTQIAQDKWAIVSESLRLLRGNEQPWMNRSGHSRQMSDRERYAQAAHDKWANEQMSNSLKKIWQKKLKSYFLECFINVFLLKKWAICSFPLFWWAMWANSSDR